MALRPATAAALLIGVGISLGGCAQGYDAMDGLQNAMHNFNPFGSNQKRLPGDRRALFPEGVPGVATGVPSDLMPGARQEPDVIAATPEPAAAPAEETRRRPQTASRPRPAAEPARERPVRQAARPAQQPQARRSAPAQPAADAVWPEPSRSSRPAADAVWPEPPRAASRPAADTVWPDPPKAASAPATDTVWPDPPQTPRQQPQRSAPRQAQQSAPPPAAAGGGWAPPAAEPVPTVWPDPPQPAR